MLNYEQLVHLKSFQSGHLTFNKKFEQVKRTILPGTTSKLRLFQNYSSILPYKAKDEEPIKYHEFQGLKRYYNMNEKPKILDD